MNRSITGRHFELTEPIKNYIEAALDGLDKYNLDIMLSSTIIKLNILYSNPKSCNKYFMEWFLFMEM